MPRLCFSHRPPGRTLAPLALPLLLCVTLPRASLAQELMPQQAAPVVTSQVPGTVSGAVVGPVAGPVAGQVLVLNLEQALQMALQQHPKLAARRASLAAAEDGKRAVDGVRIPECIA